MRKLLAAVLFLVVALGGAGAWVFAEGVQTTAYADRVLALVKEARLSVGEWEQHDHNGDDGLPTISVPIMDNSSFYVFFDERGNAIAYEAQTKFEGDLDASVGEAILLASCSIHALQTGLTKAESGPIAAALINSIEFDKDALESTASTKIGGFTLGFRLVPQNISPLEGEDQVRPFLGVLRIEGALEALEEPSAPDGVAIDLSTYGEFDLKTLFRRPRNHIGEKYLLRGSLGSPKRIERTPNGGYNGIWLEISPFPNEEHVVLWIDELEFNLFEDDWVDAYVTIIDVGPLGTYKGAPEVFYTHVDALVVYDGEGGAVIETYTRADN